MINGSTRAGARIVTAAVLGALALVVGPYAKAQAPVINSIQTVDGVKNDFPASQAHKMFQIVGNNFATSRGNSIHIEKRFDVNGVTYWIDNGYIAPFAVSKTLLSAQLGNRPIGEYRFSVVVPKAGTSNTYPLLVIPSTTKIESVWSYDYHPGSDYYLTGNLFPLAYTQITLTPPAAIAQYMGTRTITPTYKDNYLLKFKLPADVWEGTWKVQVTGTRDGQVITTNKVDLPVQIAVAPKYNVIFKGFQCVTELNDFSASDEVYACAIAFEPNHIPFSTGDTSTGGSGVYEDVDAGEWYYPSIGMGYTGDWYGYHSEIKDPTKAFFIVGLSECDQWSLNFWGDRVWTNPTAPADYAKQQAAGVVSDAYYYQALQHIPVLNNGTPAQIANWLKDDLYNLLNIGDDCLGTAVVTWSKAEMLQARLLNGQPLNKTIDFYGDGSHYKVLMQLVKY